MTKEISFRITARPASPLGDCVMCRSQTGTIYAILIGVLALRLCRDCLAQLRVEAGEVLDDNP